MVYLNTEADDDAEDESFSISASVRRGSRRFRGKLQLSATVMIADDEVQEYKLELPVALENSKEIKEGNGDDPVAMTLVVSPARTLPKSFFVNLQSAQDASDYSLSSGGTSSGGPTAVSLRIDMPVGRRVSPVRALLSREPRTTATGWTTPSPCNCSRRLPPVRRPRGTW